jgi:hypothetical protein
VECYQNEFVQDNIHPCEIHFVWRSSFGCAESFTLGLLFLIYSLILLLCVFPVIVSSYLLAAKTSSFQKNAWILQTMALFFYSGKNSLYINVKEMLVMVSLAQTLCL